MPPMTQNLPRRGGPADRRQAQVLTLTALGLRRRRGITASVLADCPVQPAPPSLLRRPTLTPDAGRRSRAYPGVKMPKGGVFEKPPVSSIQIGIMGRQIFLFRFHSGFGTLPSGRRWPPMAEHAVHPPIRLVTHSDEPIRSLEAAAKVIRRHAGHHLDPNAENVMRQIKGVTTLEQAEAAGQAFRAWAAAEGLLLVPPEDGRRG